MSYDNFGDERYHHVVLATFGLSPSCPKDPISLIDIGRLLGFSDVRAEPTLEFAAPEPGTWPVFLKKNKLRWSGQVDVLEELLAPVFATLRRHEPWPKPASPCLQ